MLQERQGVSLKTGETTIISVDEILEDYEIKGLSLSDLQEKYVNMVDEYEESFNDLDKKYESLNSNINSLEETILELQQNIENKDYTNSQPQYSPSLILSFIIAIVIAFFVGKYCNNRNK
jgi:vacuolar-type H+-ATPase subunit I/STV1